MSYLLVPQEASATTATVWVGVWGEAGVEGLALRAAGSIPGAWGNWETFTGTPQARPSVRYQRVRITDLAPRRAYLVELRRNGDVLARATLRTLPERMPRRGEKPFTVLLASCFCASKDQEGALNNTFLHLPERPDVKIYCGDQVYLDEPWYTFLHHSFSDGELAARFSKKYWDVWCQPGGAAGFRQMLADGPNYFVADDHEFWNNAPNFALSVRNSWTAAGRLAWWDLAKDLYQTFQTPRTRAEFPVETVSFLALDTRVNRQADRSRFLLDEDLRYVETWARTLPGPGILVVGQPLLSQKAGHLGRLTDWNLADYAQYGALVRALTRAPHGVVILTGDVHYGRLAEAVFASGAELIEIISSPTALVDKTAGGRWSAAPDRFPAFDIAGVIPVKAETYSPFQMTDNHFLTLDFLTAGADTELTVKAWPVASGQRPNPIVVSTRRLR